MPFKRRRPEPEPELVADPILEPEVPSGPYSGRLAFDPESGFHLAEDGYRVVTPDHGQSWLYAEDDDPSHLERYHERPLVVDSTANRHAELAVEFGVEKANELIEPHHFVVPGNDLHYNGLVFTPDKDAPKLTSHTDAWKHE